MRSSLLRRLLSRVRRQEIYFLQCFSRKPFLSKVPISNFVSCYRNTTTTNVMDLPSIVSILNSIAPTELAEDWDNVGLLIEPSSPKQISQIMLTIDLTEAVLAEAVANNVDFIVAYHPPIFRPLKNLRNDNWKNYIALKCIENKIAVYSPHTALDNVDGGINDWLLQCFDCRTIVPIVRKKVCPKYTHDIKFECGYCLPDYRERLAELLPNVEITYSSVQDGFISGTIKANESDIGALNTLAESGDSQDFFRISEITKEQSDSSVSKSGVGRQALLVNPIKISYAVEKVKNHLNLKNIRISIAKDCTLESAVQSVAVCAGSGAEVLHGTKADLFLTGEMSHHELLDAAHKGSTVILAEHSNSERPYLVHLAAVLKQQLPGVQVLCSNCDKDPILIV